jgi:hypothetical protein
MAGIALTLVATPAAAQECQSYTGQTVAPTTIDAALARYSTMTPRGEFESTTEFEARRARASGGSGPLIIGKVPDPLEYGDRSGRGDNFRYDADRQVMRVVAYAFDNMNFDHNDIWGYGGPLYSAGDYTSRFSNVDVVITQIERVTGSFRGSNAFGVSRQIARINRTMSVIYDRPLQGLGSGLFPNLDTDQVVGEIPMNPTEARALKSTMTVAFVVVPREPFVVSATDGPSSATINNPQEVTVLTRVLFGDIQCALVLDPRGRVLASYLTN